MKPTPKTKGRNKKGFSRTRRIARAWMDGEVRRVEQAQKIEQMLFRKKFEDEKWAKTIANPKKWLKVRKIERLANAHHKMALATAADAVGIGRDEKGMAQRKAIYAASGPLLDSMASIWYGGADAKDWRSVARVKERIAKHIGKVRAGLFVKKYAWEMEKNIDVHAAAKDPGNVEKGRLRKKKKGK